MQGKVIFKHEMDKKTKPPLKTHIWGRYELCFDLYESGPAPIWAHGWPARVSQVSTWQRPDHSPRQSPTYGRPEIGRSVSGQWFPFGPSGGSGLCQDGPVLSYRTVFIAVKQSKLQNRTNRHSPWPWRSPPPYWWWGRTCCRQAACWRSQLRSGRSPAATVWHCRSSPGRCSRRRRWCRARRGSRRRWWCGTAPGRLCPRSAAWSSCPPARWCGFSAGWNSAVIK